MKREKGICLLAFLSGVIIINLLGNTAWVNDSTLNRYSLASLSFRGIVYEEYFLHVLFLRLRTVLALWVASKLVPKKMVVVGFAVVTCVMLGGVTAMAILANGLWGILFCICAFLPHVLCYGAAYVLWGNMQIGYSYEGSRKADYLAVVFISMLIVIGCVLETYISPVLIENLIKY